MCPYTPHVSELTFEIYKFQITLFFPIACLCFRDLEVLTSDLATLVQWNFFIVKNRLGHFGPTELLTENAKSNLATLVQHRDLTF